MSPRDPIEHCATSRQLIDELHRHAPNVGANVTPLPSLTVYRFTGSTEPRWEDIRGLSLCIVAQGRTAATDRGELHVYDQFDYVVVGRRSRYRIEFLDASPAEPCLCLVLQIEPATVRRIGDQMRDGGGIKTNGIKTSGIKSKGSSVRYASDGCLTSSLDDELMGAVLRLVRSARTEADRNVLTPLYLRELVYRILQRDRSNRLMHFATSLVGRQPVVAAVNYISENLDENITVTRLAEHVNLSPSAFSRVFREATGSSPYQYVKHARFDRACELLTDERRSVAEVARSVGYSSTSHFIKEFRTRRGTTPGEYADAHAKVALRHC